MLDLTHPSSIKTVLYSVLFLRNKVYQGRDSHWSKIIYISLIYVIVELYIKCNYPYKHLIKTKAT